MRTVALGGKNRVGSGSKITTQLKEFERSSFDVGSTLKTTVSAGTIVPIWNDIALPGTTHDIKIYLDMMTGPTIGPLFGSFKVQADAYAIPLRLYQAQLHNNTNGIGMKMETVKLPQVRIKVPNPKATDYTKQNFDLDNFQVNPSHIVSYACDFRGAGVDANQGVAIVERDINAVPYIGYYDICKTYYCNKQEGIGYIIHSEPITSEIEIPVSNLIAHRVTDFPNVEPVISQGNMEDLDENLPPYDAGWLIFTTIDTEIIFNTTGSVGLYDPNRFTIILGKFSPTADPVPVYEEVLLGDMFENIRQELVGANVRTFATNLKPKFTEYRWWQVAGFKMNRGEEGETVPILKEFPLSDIDDLRMDILSKIKETDPYIIEFGDPTSDIPDTSVFKMPLSYTTAGGAGYIAGSLQQDQDGLCVGTHQSDIFNNWLDSEGLAIADTISAINVELNEAGREVIYVNEISLKTKVWEMMNAIQTSGGGLLDYYDAVYDHEVWMGVYSPVYCGGISKELVFQQILSTAEAGEQPLGTLAGRGVLKEGANGGSLTIKTDEPSMIMIVFKLTPRVDYSQGNAWWNNLKTMKDLHNPYMDRIGFQNLITDKMAWWDTVITNRDELTFKSAGKQTAWIDYQTNYNRVKGNFAKANNQMFMVINRNYTPNLGGATPQIKDLTTYIDPKNSNFIFADVSISAQNFWLEARIDATARRKMSSKTQPIV